MLPKFTDGICNARFRALVIIMLLPVKVLCRMAARIIGKALMCLVIMLVVLVFVLWAVATDGRLPFL